MYGMVCPTVQCHECEVARPWCHACACLAVAFESIAVGTEQKVVKVQDAVPAGMYTQKHLETATHSKRSDMLDSRTQPAALHASQQAPMSDLLDV